jgi:hypothetical protein
VLREHWRKLTGGQPLPLLSAGSRRTIMPPAPSARPGAS